MNLVNEIDRLHDLTELAQKFRPEVEHEFAVGNFAGLESGPMRTASDCLAILIVEAARALVAKADA
jgi:hypothetical protein